MTQYVLTLYQADGPPPASVDLEQIGRDLAALNQEMQEAGAWVFAGGLCSPTTATVVRVTGDEVLLSDGPYLEGKEHVGGFTIVESPDLDAAIEWARRLAVIAAPLPVEVRPFQGDGGR